MRDCLQLTSFLCWPARLLVIHPGPPTQTIIPYPREVLVPPLRDYPYPAAYRRQRNCWPPFGPRLSNAKSYSPRIPFTLSDIQIQPTHHLISRHPFIIPTIRNVIQAFRSGLIAVVRRKVPRQGAQPAPAHFKQRTGDPVSPSVYTASPPATFLRTPKLRSSCSRRPLLSGTRFRCRTATT